jgi:hypothetical protein
MTAVALAVVIGIVLAGTATAASRYIITKLSQISPTVRAELKGARGPVGPRGPQGLAGTSGVIVKTANVGGITGNTNIVSFSLPHAPSYVRGDLVFDNSGASDVHVNCKVTVGGRDVATPQTIVVPAPVAGDPLGGGSTSTDETATLSISGMTPLTGTLALSCAPVGSDNASAIKTSGTLTAIGVTNGAISTPAPAPTTTTVSPSASTSSSANPSSSSTSTASSTASASSSSTSTSSSCPLDPLCP